SRMTRSTTSRPPSPRRTPATPSPWRSSRGTGSSRSCRPPWPRPPRALISSRPATPSPPPSPTWAPSRTSAICTRSSAATPPSFVEAGTVDGANYAYPLYAGARGVFYRSDLFDAAGITVPETIDEFREAMIALGEANPEDVDGFSGMYFAAVDIHGVESFMFAAGGEYATENEDGSFTAVLDQPETLAALEQVHSLFQDATAYALDSQASQKAFEKYFNEGKVGAMIGTGNVGTKIDQELWDEDKVGVMALPGQSAGEVGQTFA